MDVIRPHKQGLSLQVRVMPKASRQELGLVRDGRLMVYLNAPPVDGAANQALIKFLAKRLNIAPANLSIGAGLKSRNKTVLIKNVDAQVLQQALGGSSVFTPPGAAAPCQGEANPRQY